MTTSGLLSVTHMSASAVGSFQPFELEYYQSQYEHDVEINLADSSVQCVSTREWLSEDEQQRLSTHRSTTRW